MRNISFLFSFIFILYFATQDWLPLLNKQSKSRSCTSRYPPRYYDSDLCPPPIPPRMLITRSFVVLTRRRRIDNTHPYRPFRGLSVRILHRKWLLLVRVPAFRRPRVPEDLSRILVPRSRLPNRLGHGSTGDRVHESRPRRKVQRCTLRSRFIEASTIEIILLIKGNPLLGSNDSRCSFRAYTCYRIIV